MVKSASSVLFWNLKRILIEGVTHIFGYGNVRMMKKRVVSEVVGASYCRVASDGPAVIRGLWSEKPSWRLAADWTR